MYDHILVPTDGSPGMDTVIDHAVNLASTHGATVHALYVVETASLVDLPVDSSWEGMEASLRQAGEVALEDFQQAAGEVTLLTEMREGAPSKEILRYADEEGCDLIVMGTHGRSGVDKLLLGSVAERVVRSADTPVMTISVDE